MVAQALIDRCILKEPKAQYELYRALHGTMLSICARYERNRQDAAGVMNLAFLKILERIGHRRPEVPFMAWARRIVINTVIDEYRRNRERKTHEHLDELPPEGPTAGANEYLVRMEAEALAELLTQVPVTSRIVFNLHVMDGYTHAEIGVLLEMSAGTSKWHVAHARTILRNTLSRLAVKASPQTASP